jgi:hypothetical protein
MGYIFHPKYLPLALRYSTDVLAGKSPGQCFLFSMRATITLRRWCFRRCIEFMKTFNAGGLLAGFRPLQ